MIRPTIINSIKLFKRAFSNLDQFSIIVGLKFKELERSYKGRHIDDVTLTTDIAKLYFALKDDDPIVMRDVNFIPNIFESYVVTTNDIDDNYNTKPPEILLNCRTVENASQDQIKKMEYEIITNSFNLYHELYPTAGMTCIILNNFKSEFHWSSVYFTRPKEL